jgi:hypothetical protein
LKGEKNGKRRFNKFWIFDDDERIIRKAEAETHKLIPLMDVVALRFES